MVDSPWQLEYITTSEKEEKDISSSSFGDTSSSSLPPSPGEMPDNEVDSDFEWWYRSSLKNILDDDDDSAGGRPAPTRPRHRGKASPSMVVVPKTGRNMAVAQEAGTCAAVAPLDMAKARLPMGAEEAPAKAEVEDKVRDYPQRWVQDRAGHQRPGTGTQRLLWHEAGRECLLDDGGNAGRE